MKDVTLLVLPEFLAARWLVHLVVFDVDGTLINPVRSTVADYCFLRSLREVLGLTDNDPCWVEGLQHVTGRCIATQLCEQRLGRPIADAELTAIVDTYDELLKNALRDEEKQQYATLGAREVFAELASSAKYACAIATGDFRRTADRKLSHAGFSIQGVPLAASDSHISRESIMHSALESASAAHPRFDWVTYVGDGAWDLRSASNLGWHFIGINTGDAAGALRSDGARWVLPHFLQREELYSVLGQIERSG